MRLDYESLSLPEMSIVMLLEDVMFKEHQINFLIKEATFSGCSICT